jgi:hypothetical protein
MPRNLERKAIAAHIGRIAEVPCMPMTRRHVLTAAAGGALAIYAHQSWSNGEQDPIDQGNGGRFPPNPGRA